MRLLALPLAMLTLQAQSVLTPDLETLTKIRLRMQFNLEHQPNYTCVETIERSQRPKSTKKAKIVDTVRLEVALVDGREMFAWPGSKKFDNVDVTKMVTTGAIGNGNFATHARALFTTRNATFKYRGEETRDGHQSIRFDYNVPRMLSAYTIRTGTVSAIVGYHGSFYANPQTFDMQRIEVLADDLPPELMLSSTEDDIDYAVARIGAGDFLLPAHSQLSMTDLHGSENENHVKFSACREYSGESVITFDDAPASQPEAEPIPTREFDLPPNLDFELTLADTIDLRTAAVGDVLRARLEYDLKDKGERVLPKGAIATGRITRLEKYDDVTLLGVEFAEIDAPGIVAHMSARLDHTVGMSPLRINHSVHVRSALLPGEGIIPVSAIQFHLARGCIMFWRTQIK